MESREMRLTRLVEAHQGLLLRICYVKLADIELARALGLGQSAVSGRLARARAATPPPAPISPAH